jgi:hypothetical protein
MDLKKILTFGDGYSANHIWPEWPAIVQALYPELEHENFGAVGAGNEFITTAIVQAHKTTPDAFFIVQWGHAHRLDKLLQDSSWDHVIDNDSIYHFNRVRLNDQTWWLSSASTQEQILHYHNFYVQDLQSYTRTTNFKYLVKNLLKNQSLFFTLKEMIDYASADRFKQVRQNHVQPSPIVHMSWVEEKILPNMPRQPENSRLSELKSRINCHDWRAFDPDRAEIWAKMSVI